jgi:hypothetical protein
VKPPIKTTALPQSSGDSLLGMAFAVALVGAAFGSFAGPVWQTAETAAAFHEDRYEARTRTNGPAHGAGFKESVKDMFSQSSQAGAFSFSPVTKRFYGYRLLYIPS